MLESDIHDSLLDAVPKTRIREDIELTPKQVPKMVTLLDDDDAVFNGVPDDTTGTL